MQRILGMCILVFLSGLLTINATYAQTEGCFMSKVAQHVFHAYLGNLEEIKKHHLVNTINFNYGTGVLAKNIGSGSIIVKMDDNQDISLHITGEIKVVGQTINIREHLYSEDLYAGNPMKVYLPGKDESFLEIVPEEGFGPEGGNLTIWYRDEDQDWKKESFSLQLVGNSFSLFSRGSTFYKKVNKLGVSLSGYSLSSIGVADFSLN